jgi:TatD DNase family protein
MPSFIDSHAHLYLPEFDEDRAAMMQRVKDAGIEKIFLPNIDSSTIDALLNFEREFSERAYAMMGLHPCSVKENVTEELKILKHLFSQRKFAAVGETGLDFYWDVTFKEQQMAAFRDQIDLALQYHLPVVIHSRNSTRDCIDIVREKKDGNLQGVFHCFSGTAAEAQEIIDLGFYLGIGGVITFKKSTLPDVIKDVDLSHLLLETDAPYLAPVPYRGKRNESSYIPLIAEKIAAIKNTDVAEVAKVTMDNANRLFRF